MNNQGISTGIRMEEVPVVCSLDKKDSGIALNEFHFVICFHTREFELESKAVHPIECVSHELTRGNVFRKHVCDRPFAVWCT